MIAFVIENENPFALKLTASFLQNLDESLDIIPLGNNGSEVLYETILNYEEPFFLVFRAGEKISGDQYKELLCRLGDLVDQDCGIADEDEKNGLIPVVWRTTAVLEILKPTERYFYFKEYLFHHLYFALQEKSWTWERVKQKEYVACQLQEPRWKNRKMEWELLHPVLSARTSNEYYVNPMVSIVICTYNDACYLSCAIQSVLVQSNANWELIIVDDGSTDNTQKILSSYEDPRIVMIKNNENHGKAKSLHRALSISKGDWFLELDADDWLSVDCIDTMLSQIDRYDDAVLLYGNYYEWIERHNKNLVYSQIRVSPTLLEQGILVDNPLPIAPRMYSTSFLNEVNGWCVTDVYDGRLYEDIYLLSQCIDRPYRHVSQPLYHRRIRKNSITQREKGKFNHWKKWFAGM